MSLDRRGFEPRSNGGGGRPPSGPPSHPPSTSRQPGSDGNSTDVDSFRLTRILGEATYKYAKMKDAENDKIQCENDWTRNSQYFDSNPKLKETYDTRRNKTERMYATAKQDYIRAARDAEPLLSRIEEFRGADLMTRDARDQVNRMLSEELRDRQFVSLRRLNDEMRESEDRMVNATDKRRKDDLRNYALRNEFERLSNDVRNMNFNPRSRQMSVSSDVGSREVEQRLQPRIDNLQKDLSKEVRNLNDRIANLQKDFTAQPQPQISLTPTAKVEDVVRIETAVEKAQAVINDQYVNLHDLRLQVESMLEGIRILNAHIEEYDTRLDSLQSGTQNFLAEIKSENERRNAILSDAFEKLHKKIATEVSAKIDSSPVTPASASFPSTYAENLRQPPSRTAQQPLDVHAKQLQDSMAAITFLTSRIRDLENQVNPNLVPKGFIDAMNTRLNTTAMELIQLRTDHNALGATFAQYRQSQVQLNQNTENNFRETAIHMDMVKRRFGEHREQLDQLIKAYEGSQDEMNELTRQHTRLQEMWQSRVAPMWNRIVRHLPEVDDGRRNQRAASTSLPDAAASRQGLAIPQPPEPTEPAVALDEQRSSA